MIERTCDDAHEVELHLGRPRRRPRPGRGRGVTSAAAVLAVAAGLAACGDDDEAEPIPTEPTIGPYAVADLDVEVQRPEGDLSYGIVCDGDTAELQGDTAGSDGVVDAIDACTALTNETLETRLTEGPDEDRICAEVFGGPQTATITGTIEGQEVDASFGRTNACEIDDWDVLLSDVLPPVPAES